MGETDHIAKLAHRVIIGVFKIILPDVAARIEGFTDIAEAMSDGRAGMKAKKSLVRHLDDAAAALAERLEKIAAVEFALPKEDLAREVAIAEREIAIEVVAKVFSEQVSSNSVLIRSQMDAGVLAGLLEPHAREIWRRELLSDDSIEFGRTFLSTACQYLIRLARLQPDFEREVIWDSYLLIQHIQELLERGMDTVVRPRYREGTPTEHSLFEAQYLSDVLETYQNMELFGIDVPSELRQQRIDVAYITLEVTTSPATQLITRDPGIESASVSAHTRKLRVDMAFRQIVLGRSTTLTGARILLTGAAGSGKTTVTQWIAANAAARSFPETLDMWNGCVPFVVQLRHVFHGQTRVFPRPQDLMRSASQQGSNMPGGWQEKVLKSGEAIVVFDGFDELSPLHRRDAEVWLSKLMRDYERSHFIVTSRPEGVSHGWYETRFYKHVALEPMAIEDIRLCVKSWYNALVRVMPNIRRAHYRKSELALLRDLERQRGLRLLVESPLLCAMLCAFYAIQVVDSAPSTQAELYERVIRALVDTRGRTRGVSTDDYLLLGEYEKLQILQAVASHMNDQGLAVINCFDESSLELSTLRVTSTKSAMTVVQERTAELAALRGDARGILDHLLRRSIVFRRVSPNEAQFSHRTFQEYLAACDYAASGRIRVLLGHATDPVWRRTIAFAARAAMPDATSKLVAGLLDLAQSDPGNQRDLLMLAAECLIAGGRVTPAVLERTRSAMTTVVPPRTVAEADHFASFGEGIVPWLAGHEHEGPEVVAACIRAAARIGGDRALAVIAGYSSTPMSADGLREVVEAWSAFDPQSYAEKVLNTISFENEEVLLTDAMLLDHIGFAQTLRHVRLGIKEGLRDFRKWAGLTGLQSVDVGSYWRLDSIAGLEKLTNLTRLNLSANANITDFEPISHLHKLRELYLSRCAGLSDPAPLTGLRELRVLVLDGTGCCEHGWIASLPALISLSLDRCDVSSLEFLSSLSKLRALRVKPREGLKSGLDLSNCPDLRRLELSISAFNTEDIVWRENAPLEDVTLLGARCDDVKRLGSAKLRRLRVSHAHGMTDLTALSQQTGLRVLNVSECTSLRTGEGAEVLTELEELDLSGTGITDVGFAQGLQKLHTLRLDNCAALTDLSGLEGLKNLRYLSLYGVFGLPNIDVWAASLASAQLTVHYDDFGDAYGPTA